MIVIRPLGYEKVYLPLYKVADSPFHIQGDGIMALLTFLLTLSVRAASKMIVYCCVSHLSQRTNTKRWRIVVSMLAHRMRC